VGKGFCGWVAETRHDIRTGRAIRREIDRALKLAGYCLRSDRTKAPVSRSIAARVRRNGLLEKAGAYIQAESGHTECCAQDKPAKQSDGHQRIKACLGFGNGAYRDIRSDVHGNLQWKNNQLIFCRNCCGAGTTSILIVANENFDCG
jgi:hypothetical protein